MGGRASAPAGRRLLQILQERCSDLWFPFMWFLIHVDGVLVFAVSWTC